MRPTRDPARLGVSARRRGTRVAGDAQCGTNDLEILYEDNHLLAVNKPAGLPTMGVAADEPSLFVLAKQYIKRRYRTSRATSIWAS